MSAPKRGLGRGLDALLGQERPKPAGPGLAAIPVNAIRPNPQQPRKTFAPDALAELERSIRELGVLVPIIVRPLPASAGAPAYELIAGERRWRASAAARLETIPAIVRDADDRTSLEVAVVENLQRRDLDPLEEAMGFQHLIEAYGFTQERLAERIGKSRPAIANALRLLGLPDELKALLRAGSLSAGHARALLSVDGADRAALAERIARDGLSVREVERYAERKRGPAAERTPARAVAASPARSPDLQALESRLRYRLGAPVSIARTAAGGRIEIRFSDESDLGRLADLLVPEAS